MTFLTKALAAPAMMAAASLTAMPAAAAELPTQRHAPIAATIHYGPYYGGHWGGYRHRRGPSAGGILAGVLILGTVAAVASAASKNTQQRRGYPDRYPYPDRRGDYRTSGPQGLEGAADLCMREVERNARVREVTRVERSAGGWLVTGAMADGAGFSCSIGPDGRIDRVDIGDRAQTFGDADPRYGTDRQYDDERYRSARADVDARADVEAGPQPAYPGGPLPGEDVEGEYSPQS